MSSKGDTTMKILENYTPYVLFVEDDSKIDLINKPNVKYVLEFEENIYDFNTSFTIS